MYENLKILLGTADKRLEELECEYEKALTDKMVSGEAKQLTHDVCEKLRSALDRVARRYFDLKIAPSLPSDETDRVKVYFPILEDQHGFDSELGRWRWKPVKNQHQEIYEYLKNLQIFVSDENKWLHTLNAIAVAGKHIDLIPQKRFENRTSTVSSKGGSVSWGSGVRFGSGVSIMGAPINPHTQQIAPTPGLSQKFETWVSFIIEGHNVNALGFCQSSSVKVRQIVEEMSEKFGL